MAEGTTPDSIPPAVNLRSATKPPALPAQRAGQQDEDIPSIGPPARNLRPHPLHTINGRPIYSEDKKVSGTHFILRQFATDDDWGTRVVGIICKPTKTTPPLTRTIVR